MIDLSPIPLSAVPWLLGAGSLLAAAGVGVSSRATRPRQSNRSRALLTRTPDAVQHAQTKPSRVATPIESAGPSISGEGPRPTRVASDLRRHDDASLTRLGARLAENRRRAAARTRLGEDLAMLDRRYWHVERDVTVAGVTFPFVVFGPRGVFALTSSHGWDMSDLTVLESASKDLAGMLPCHADPVRAAIYLPYDVSAPRSWFNGQGAGGWIVGGGHLLEFLEHFNDHGFAASDIEMLRAKATPDGHPKPLAHLPLHAPQG
jgi:hypothetical protein